MMFLLLIFLFDARKYAALDDDIMHACMICFLLERDYKTTLDLVWGSRIG